MNKDILNSVLLVVGTVVVFFGLLCLEASFPEKFMLEDNSNFQITEPLVGSESGYQIADLLALKAPARSLAQKIASENPTEAYIVVDGILQKIEGTSFYILEGATEFKTVIKINIDQFTKIKELSFKRKKVGEIMGPDSELVSEKDIESSDLKEGDSLSALVSMNSVKERKDTAFEVRRMITIE